MRLLAAIFLVAAPSLSGCHVGPAVTPSNPPVAMTLFAAANDDFPDVASTLNQRLRGTYPRGPLVTHAAISMDEAQVAVGCVDSDNECWNQVADPLATPALLVAEVKHDGQRGVRISLQIYDASAGRVLRQAVRAYASAAEARAGVPDVVDLLVAAREGGP